MSRKIDVPALWSQQMGQAVAKQQELAAGAYSTDQSIEQMRQAYDRERAFWNEGGPVPASVREELVDTGHGPVTVRMYRPTQEARLPVIVYIHGGGWVVGGLDTHDRITRTLACEAEAAVVAVDYTLAPEARFPQAIEECAAVVQAILADPEHWGAEPGNVSLAGDSGGASLALATFLMVREAGRGASITSLLLFYGAYGLRDSASMRLLGGPWDGLTESDLAWYRSQYLRDEADAAHPYVDLLKGDFTYEVPPCYLVSAALDPLKDDSATLATVLNLSGVDVAHREVPGVIHGFLHHGRILDAARQTLAEAGDFHRHHAGTLCAELGEAACGVDTGSGQAVCPASATGPVSDVGSASDVGPKDSASDVGPAAEADTTSTARTGAPADTAGPASTRTPSNPTSH